MKCPLVPCRAFPVLLSSAGFAAALVRSWPPAGRVELRTLYDGSPRRGAIWRACRRYDEASSSSPCPCGRAYERAGSMHDYNIHPIITAHGMAHGFAIDHLQYTYNDYNSIIIGHNIVEVCKHLQCICEIKPEIESAHNITLHIASACKSTQSDIDTSGPFTSKCNIGNQLPDRQAPRFSIFC